MTDEQKMREVFDNERYCDMVGRLRCRAQRRMESRAGHGLRHPRLLRQRNYRSKPKFVGAPHVSPVDCVLLVFDKRDFTYG